MYIEQPMQRVIVCHDDTLFSFLSLSLSLSQESGGSMDKRAHHNALERRRRDHIKDSFYSLRDCIPAMQGEKVGQRIYLYDNVTCVAGMLPVLETKEPFNLHVPPLVLKGRHWEGFS